MSSSAPTLYIIAGCNGAGKTTASYTVLPELLDCNEFVNADEIARGLSPFNPGEMAIEAGKLMIERMNQLIASTKTFAVETTLASRSYINLIQKVKEKGYRIVLVFFWLPSPDMAIERVAKRVAEGGHNIPYNTIIRRYWRGISNFFTLFIPEVDVWILYENIHYPSIIASNEKVWDNEKFNRIKESCQKRK